MSTKLNPTKLLLVAVY